MRSGCSIDTAMSGTTCGPPTTPQRPRRPATSSRRAAGLPLHVLRRAVPRRRSPMKTTSFSARVESHAADRAPLHMARGFAVPICSTRPFHFLTPTKHSDIKANADETRPRQHVRGRAAALDRRARQGRRASRGCGSGRGAQGDDRDGPSRPDHPGASRAHSSRARRRDPDRATRLRAGPGGPRQRPHRREGADRPDGAGRAPRRGVHPARCRHDHRPARRCATRGSRAGRPDECPADRHVALGSAEHHGPHDRRQGARPDAGGGRRLGAALPRRQLRRRGVHRHQRHQPGARPDHARHDRVGRQAGHDPSRATLGRAGGPHEGRAGPPLTVRRPGRDRHPDHRLGPGCPGRR